MTPFFTPRPIDQPSIPIHVAAINAYNCRLAGELGDGIRMHGLITPKYTREVILPNLEAGAGRAGRSLGDIDIVGTGFTITGPDEQAIHVQMHTVKQQIAFYASTPAYLPVMSLHGWDDEHRELHRLSRQGDWEKMTEMISEEMLSAFANIGTFDEIAAKIRSRWGGISTRMFFSIPTKDPDDEARLAGILADLKS